MLPPVTAGMSMGLLDIYVANPARIMGTGGEETLRDFKIQLVVILSES